MGEKCCDPEQCPLVARCLEREAFNRVLLDETWASIDRIKSTIIARSTEPCAGETNGKVIWGVPRDTSDQEEYAEDRASAADTYKAMAAQAPEGCRGAKQRRRFFIFGERIIKCCSPQAKASNWERTFPA